MTDRVAEGRSMGRHASPDVPPPLGRVAAGGILGERGPGGGDPNAPPGFPIGPPLRSVAPEFPVGAGAKQIDVAAGLAPTGAIVPGGTCATVGIAGLALGGGQGVTGRLFGLTCDSLKAATVVTADGRILTCDPDTNPDLYWALRG